MIKQPKLVKKTDCLWCVWKKIFFFSFFFQLERIRKKYKPNKFCEKPCFGAGKKNFFFFFLFLVEVNILACDFHFWLKSCSFLPMRYISSIFRSEAPQKWWKSGVRLSRWSQILLPRTSSARSATSGRCPLRTRCRRRRTRRFRLNRQSIASGLLCWVWFWHGGLSGK